RALGGPANLKAVSACTTRLRLVVVSRDAVDEPALKRLGARGMISPSPTDLQVVLGPIADAVADEIRACLGEGGPAVASDAGADAIRRALGSAANIREVAVRASRLCIRVARAEAVDLPALELAVPKGAVMTGPDTLQLIVGENAEAMASNLAAP
ncbi:MAG TPA: PTS transporter subunit EIIB, partial [Brevundimonas sp.]|nr:PTS transporter subunit EIIB [Brevundimonas sp.]